MEIIRSKNIGKISTMEFKLLFSQYTMEIDFIFYPIAG